MSNTQIDIAPELHNIIAEIKDLPAMSDIISEFLVAMSNPNCSAKSLAQIVSKDPTVSARVLKVANSAYYSFERQITSIEQAIAILGQKTLKSLVLAASLKGLNRSSGLLEKMLLEDSIGCAMAARIIATKTGLSNPDDAFVCGLFRHIGKIVMMTIDPDGYRAVVQGVYNETGTLAQLEKENFPYSHAVFGAAVLEKWNFAGSIVLTAYHHNTLALDAVDQEETYWLAATVNAAGAICERLGIGHKEPNKNIDLGRNKGISALGLSAPMVKNVAVELKEAFDETKSLFTS